MHLETIAVHAAAEADRVTGSIAPPIHLSTTFEHGPASEHIHGYSYIREANPTQTRLETALAELEGGEAALAFASGMGAGTAVLQTLAPGSHIIMPDDVYVDFRNLVKEFFFKWQLEHTVVDTSQIDQVRAARRTNTQLIWLETPSNPLLKVTDIGAVVELAKTLTRREHEVMTAVVQGLMNKQIAFNLGISEITVKLHRGNVMRKMEARSVADLVRKAELLGL